MVPAPSLHGRTRCLTRDPQGSLRVKLKRVSIRMHILSQQIPLFYDSTSLTCFQVSPKHTPSLDHWHENPQPRHQNYR